MVRQRTNRKRALGGGVFDTVSAMRTLRLTWLALSLWGCGPSSREAPPPPPPPIPDADGDGISDGDEGVATAVDTDRDGTPDYLDRDSDGDTLTDATEAGDRELATPPVDSDQDGKADVRDLDADGNGRDDEIEGSDDLDRDGVGNFADPDDDGDFISDRDELGPNPNVALDTDNDGVGDVHDFDSDGDGVIDLYEGGGDFDHDGLANFRDLDSDGDCRPDRLEAGGPPPRDSDRDRRYDFLDRDADNDGVADRDEDKNCDGALASDESDPLRADTDGDGVDDLVETEAGTNPNNATDNPRAHGDFVFVVPYQQPQLPASDTLDFRPALANVDMYVLIDRSASMSQETQSIKNSLGTVIRDLQCAPIGNGAPGDCISNLYAGLGGIGYRTDQPFVNYLSMQASPNIAGTSIPNVGGTATVEPLVFGLWTAITNLGSDVVNSTYGCGLNAVAANPSCPPGTFGQACFRPGSLPVLVLATDEPPLTELDTSVCPGWGGVTLNALGARSAKVVGVYGSGSSSTTTTNLATMALDTGSVDASAGGVPLVFNGADANAATAIGDGIRALVRGVPLDMGAVANDLPGDAVNAVTAFVDHLETLQPMNNPLCSTGLSDTDTNGDTYRDQFVDVHAGVPLCWKVAAKSNQTVPAIDRPQLFRARVDVIGDGVTVVATRNVFFLVPPQSLDGPIE
jgi:hypothetical protein